MQIPFQCSHCGCTGKAPDKYAGQLVDCPRCKGPVEIARAEWTGAVPPTPPAAKRPTPDEAAKQLRRTQASIIGVCAAVAFVAGVALGSTGYDVASAILVVSGMIAGVVALGLASPPQQRSERPPSSPPNAARRPATPGPATELEALLQIDRRLKRVEEHAAKAQSQIGCLLWLLVALVILSSIGALIASDPKVIIERY